MIAVVTGHDAVVRDWAGERLGVTIPEPAVGLGVVEDDRLVGAIVFHGREGANIDVAVVWPGRWYRGVLRACAHYAFIQSGVERITAHTARSNVRARKLLPRLGFQFEGVAKRYYGPRREDDALVYAGFRAEAERWLH